MESGDTLAFSITVEVQIHTGTQSNFKCPIIEKL